MAISRLTTGIDVLDHRPGGGIPAGSIAHLIADSTNQSELFLHELTTMRGTLWLTTIRSAEAVSDAFDRGPGPARTPAIRDTGGNTPLGAASSLVRDLPEGVNLIIDVADMLERNESARYRELLNGLRTHTVNTCGLTVLYGLKGESVLDNRDLAERMADVMFDLDTKMDGSKIVNRLAVPKSRDGRVLDETVKLQLVERVSVDTSRDIA